jgi:hypothetical protein
MSNIDGAVMKLKGILVTLKGMAIQREELVLHTIYSSIQTIYRNIILSTKSLSSLDKNREKCSVRSLDKINKNAKLFYEKTPLIRIGTKHSLLYILMQKRPKNTNITTGI